MWPSLCVVRAGLVVFAKHYTSRGVERLFGALVRTIVELASATTGATPTTTSARFSSHFELRLPTSCRPCASRLCSLPFSTHRVRLISVEMTHPKQSRNRNMQAERRCLTSR